MNRILGLIFCMIISTQAFGQQDLQKIKTHITKELLKVQYSDYYTKLSDSLTEKALSEIKKDGSWPEINYEDLSLTGFEHRYHIENLSTMALSYSKTSSAFYKNKELKNAINKALIFWCKNDFIGDNWWHNIIFVPKWFATICFIMEKDIDPDVFEKMKEIISRANRENPWARPSADKTRISGIEAKYYVLIGDQTRFEEVVSVIENEIKFSTGNRGLQSDYSFHHRVHRENNTATYGEHFGEALINWAAHVANTKYAFAKEKIELIVDFYLDGVCKQMVYGKYQEKGSANREITRKETKLISSIDVLETIFELTDYRKQEVQEIINLRNGTIEKPTRSFCKFFWQSELFVFQRPDFYASVRMYSTRNRNMELAHNGEGIFNHHRGDGTNHLTIRGDEYWNIWPAYDWQKIPGATVLQKPELPSQHNVQKDGLTDFVGATTDGFYGVAAFDFISPHDHIRAKKSWFFFDEEYVCLGAGIASNSFQNTVATTINQALLRGDVIVSNATDKMKIEAGEHEIDQAKWVFHDGTAYIFPEPVKINLSNKTENGRWSDINLQATSPKELVEKEIFKLWIDHGKRPQGENLWLYPGKMNTKEVTYQYMVVPRVTFEELEADRGVKIVSNTSQIQSVKHTGLGMIQIVFYEAGKIEVKPGLWVSLDTPGMIMLKMKEDTIEKISASDPTRKMSKLHIGITGKDEVVVELPQGDYAGRSITIDIN